MRSMLFLPGNTPSILINGDALGADGVIFDLEDAVAPDQKDAARILVRNTLRALGFDGCKKVVRINSIDTTFWKDDLRALVPLKPDYIMPPKVCSAADVLAVDAFLTELEEKCGLQHESIGLIPLIETALGVENAFAIASSCTRVRAIFLGAEDLTADLRCKRTKEGDEIFYARTSLVCAARAACVDVFDTPFTDVNDDEGALADCYKAKSLGFSGKASISPRHVTLINEAFSPTQAEIEYAREVLSIIESAKAQGKGAVALRGKMIDAPIVARAQQALASAEALGLGGAL